MCTSSIHGEELPLHIEEAHVRAAAEGGVHEAAAPAGERRHRPDEPPRPSALRGSILLPGARSHDDGGDGEKGGATRIPIYPFVFFTLLRMSCGRNAPCWTAGLHRLSRGQRRLSTRAAAAQSAASIRDTHTLRFRIK